MRPGAPDHGGMTRLEPPPRVRRRLAGRDLTERRPGPVG